MTTALTRLSGSAFEITITVPWANVKKIYDQVRYSQEMVDKVRELACCLSDEQIAAQFNGKGLCSAKERPFTQSMIDWIRRKHGIPSVQQLPYEFTVGQTMKKFGVSRHVVYYWIECGVVKVRRIKAGSPYWLKIDPEKEQELLTWVQGSKKIPKLS